MRFSYALGLVLVWSMLFSGFVMLEPRDVGWIEAWTSAFVGYTLLYTRVLGRPW